MGLRQEAETSFGNQSDRLLPHRSLGRLSWFETRFPRKSFNSGIAAAGALAAVGIPFRTRAQVESPADIAQDQEQLLSDAVTSWSAQAIKEEALGELFELTGIPLSLGFHDQAGYSKLFQTMLVSLDPNGNPFLRYLLTEMEQKGFDTYNVPPFLGDAAPKKGVFTINPSDQVKQKVAALGRVFSLSLQINGADSFAGYNSFRVGDRNEDITGLIEYTQEELKNTIRMAHFASLAIQAGVVPQNVMLTYEELATGGGSPAPVEALTRPFLPEYKISWPDGKSFTVINPERGRKGWVLNPDKVVQLPVRDPNTFIPIRDSEGNLIMKPSTIREELKKPMDEKKVPEILFIPAYLLSIEKPLAVFSVGGGTTTELDKKPYLYFDVIARPPAFPNALVYAYEFADDETELDTERQEAVFASIGQFLGEGIYYFNSVPPNTTIRPKEGTPTDLGVIMYTLRITKPVEHVYY